MDNGEWIMDNDGVCSADDLYYPLCGHLTVFSGITNGSFDALTLAQDDMRF